MTQFVPSFTCKYCGESKASVVQGDAGYFVPCQCKEAREKQDQEHYRAMELKKKLRRGTS